MGDTIHHHVEEVANRLVDQLVVSHRNNGFQHAHGNNQDHDEGKVLKEFFLLLFSRLDRPVTLKGIVVLVHGNLESEESKHKCDNLEATHVLNSLHEGLHGSFWQLNLVFSGHELALLLVLIFFFFLVVILLFILFRGRISGFRLIIVGRILSLLSALKSHLLLPVISTNDRLKN